MSERDPLWRRYQRFFRPDPAADADDELTFHLEELARQYRTEGMDEAGARRAAQARFGDVNEARRNINASLERRQRRSQRTEWWRRVGFDVRIAVRKALRRPTFTLAAVATLALGIGANGAVFSVVNAALFRALPYPDAGSIVRLDEIVRGRPFSVSPANFADFHDQTHAFSGMAAFNEGVSTLTGPGDPLPLSNATVTRDFFGVMRVRPALGRAFEPAEFVAGEDRVAILSDPLWRSTFGARADIAGQNIQLDGKTYLVIGVMPPGFAYPDGTKLWTPMALSSAETSNGQRGAHYLTVVARLKPGMSVEAASRDAASIAAMLASTYPATNKGNGSVVRTLRDDLVGPSLRRALLVLFGAVAMVALIAAVNVANLLLARGAAQEREFAVRTALGARPRDLIGFAFVESLLLALTGGGGGLLVAWGGTRVLDMLRPADLEFLGAANVDVAVLGFTLALSIASGLMFGLAPAIQAARATNVHGTLKAGGRGQTIGRHGWRVRGGLVAAELALAIVLLTGAGLLLRSFQNLQRVDMGFDARDVLTYQLSLPDSRYPKAGNVELFYQSLLDRMRSLPGVRSAGAISGLPLDGYGYSISTRSLDGTDIEASAQPSTQVRFVTSGTFATLRMPVIEGRDITDRDREGTPNVVVMSAAAAKLLFGDKDPLGHALTISTTFGDGRGRLGGEVVGVVKDVHDVSPGTPPRPVIYLSHAQFPASDMTVIARTAAGDDPLALAQAAHAQVRDLDRDLPITSVRTMSAVARGSVAQSRFAMLLLACFAIVALSLAAVGVFGVMSFMVAQRTREIGVRIALGASARKVVVESMRRCITPVAGGVLLGVAGALLLGRTMTSLLYDVRPGDPALLTVVAAGLALVAFAAAWLPARRASHVDPVVTLRDE